MNVLEQALAGTEVRGNASREFHLSVTVLGLSHPIRGTIVDTENPATLGIQEYELSRNGQWLEVEAPARFIVKEILTSAQVIYLDGGK